MKRCPWAESNELEAHYHDVEWGVPVYDDRILFELLTLEGAQAGLSWATVLAKREGYRKVFKNFDVSKVAKFGQAKQDELALDERIIRHKLKIKSTVENAKCFLEVQKEYGTFSEYIWSFVNARPIQNRWKTSKSVPSETKESIAMSKDLKKRGFKFVGPTICYAFMQASGMVNDHLMSCFRYNCSK